MDNSTQRIMDVFRDDYGPHTRRKIQEKAEVTKKTALKYLDWFEELGLISREKEGRKHSYSIDPYYRMCIELQAFMELPESVRKKQIEEAKNKVTRLKEKLNVSSKEELRESDRIISENEEDPFTAWSIANQILIYGALTFLIENHLGRVSDREATEEVNEILNFRYPRMQEGETLSLILSVTIEEREEIAENASLNSTLAKSQMESGVRDRI